MSATPPDKRPAEASTAQLDLPSVLSWIATELGQLSSAATTLQDVIAALPVADGTASATLQGLQDLDRLTQKSDVLSRFVHCLSTTVADQPVEAVDRLLETLVLGELSDALLARARESGRDDTEDGWVDFF
ncbi:MAG: hypothetical protein WBF53_03560 [Litorimonas sp.]